MLRSAAMLWSTAMLGLTAMLRSTAMPPLVSGDARIYGNAWEFSPLQAKGVSICFHMFTHRTANRTPARHTAIEWKRHSYRSESNGYTKDQIEEYGLIVNMAAQWLEMKFGGKERKENAEA